VNQSIEPMDIPSNAEINQSRLDRLRDRLSQAAACEANDETSLLQELIQRVGQEHELTADQLALAAMKLAVGDQPLLVSGDESWLQTPLRNDRRDDRRGDRGRDRRRPDREARPPEDNMTRYRVEVGHRDRVKPGNLVGAIANESGLQGRMIGRIQIFESHSFVDLPKGMPEDVFNALRRLKVLNRELQITQAS
jgi:ATP-dependent RNA helicase DeaD